MKTKEQIKIIHNLHTKDIAKQIRLDLKEKFWKQFTFSVISNRNRIDISIMKGTIQLLNPEYVKQKTKAKLLNIREEWNKLKNIKEYTECSQSIIKEVEYIVELYNHNNCDLMTDYFDVNYYSNVSVWHWNKPYIFIW